MTGIMMVNVFQIANKPDTEFGFGPFWGVFRLALIFTLDL